MCICFLFLELAAAAAAPSAPATCTHVHLCCRPTRPLPWSLITSCCRSAVLGMTMRPYRRCAVNLHSTACLLHSHVFLELLDVEYCLIVTPAAFCKCLGQEPVVSLMQAPGASNCARYANRTSLEFLDWDQLSSTQLDLLSCVLAALLLVVPVACRLGL